ncbi:MAG: hypothetical protein AB3P11_06615 [Wolbachia pipientis]
MYDYFFRWRNSHTLLEGIKIKAGVPIDVIAQITGLLLDEIKKLRN